MKTTPLTRVIALVLAAPLAVTPALAQDDGTQPQSEESSQGGEASGQSQGAQSGDAGSGQMSSPDAMDPEQLIATVDGTEITAGDVQTAIDGLPQQMRQQMPPEMLASMAVDQLVLRQLILQEAEAQNLSEDEEVQQLIEENQRASEEDAILQVYVQRQLEGAVTDEKVQETYDEISSQTEEEVPPLDAVRPQIEQQLRQQRLGEVRDDLMQDVEIVYYGPDGEPMEASAQPGGTSGQGESASGSDSEGSSASDSQDAEGDASGGEGSEDGTSTEN